MKDKLLATMLLASLTSIPFSSSAMAKNELAAPANQPGAICKTTLGLNPANADYDACERTLLRYRPGLSGDARVASQAVPGDTNLSPARGRSAFEESCAELGIDPATDTLNACARDLDASLFELKQTAAE